MSKKTLKEVFLLLLGIGFQAYSMKNEAFPEKGETKEGKQEKLNTDFFIYGWIFLISIMEISQMRIY